MGASEDRLLQGKAEVMANVANAHAKLQNHEFMLWANWGASHS